MTPGPASRTDTAPRIGLGAALTRALGVLLWRAAQPATLPVPPPSPAPSRADPAQSTRAPAPRPAAQALLRVTAASAWILAVAAFALTAVTAQQIRGLRHDFQTNPPGLSLQETATRLRSRVESAWWARLYPGLVPRAGELADAVAAGRERLLDAHRIYATVADTVNALGPAGRHAHGPALVRPGLEALERVDRRWHRETLAFHELRNGLAPYRHPAPLQEARLQGRVFQLAAGHALRIEILDPAGDPLERATPPLVPGDRFDVPWRPGATVLLTDLIRPVEGGAYQVHADLRLPIESWSQRAIRFDQGGHLVQVSFDPSTLALAPAIPPLSDAAAAELGASR